jgi:hypothetical protein
MTATAARLEPISSADVELAPSRKAAELLSFPSQTASRTVADRLHPGVQGIALLGYLWIFVVLWLVFGAQKESAFAVGVSTFYALMFFGVPLTMLRFAKRASAEIPHGSLAQFLHGRFDTNTGPISGWAALAQVATIPISLGFGLTAIGLIIVLQR